MRTFTRYLALLAVLLMAQVATAQTTQAATQASSSSTGEAIGPMLVLGITAVCLLVLIGVGLALGMLVIGVVAALLFMGVLSTSIVVGLKEKRLESSARAFVVQLAAILGAFGGGVVFCIAALIFHTHQSMRMTLGLGIICGVASGIVVGLLLDTVWRRVRAWIISRKKRTPITDK